MRNNKLRRSLFGHRIHQNKFRDLLILMVIISQKQTLANKLFPQSSRNYFVKNPKILLCPRTPPDLWMFSPT